MALVDLVLEPDRGVIPPHVRRYLADAHRRIDEFLIRNSVTGFVPSDYEDAYRLLSALRQSGLARGDQFCEWGSGFGVVVGLAAYLDFAACGIETEPDLVQEACSLLTDHNVDADLVCGSFVPREGADAIHQHGEFAWLQTDADYAYDELGIEPLDLDVVYAYPWPDEELMTQELFEKACGVGAILVSFHGNGNFRVRRKVRRKGSRRT